MGNREVAERRVGVEVEFSGIELPVAADIIQKAIQARREAVSDHEILLYSPMHDEPYRLEVDFELLKSLSREDQQDLLTKLAIDVLDLASSVVAPLEWITPPLPFDELQDLVPVLDALVAAGAVGSQGSWAYAFGAQFNPDAERLDADYLLAHLRAFCCLHDWLRARDDMDLARRLTTFAKPYPAKYEKHILAAGYAPTVDELLDDYLEFVPTRNCALDMLPLFAHMDEERVRSRVDDERVKARPTFHYRLPNSRLGAEDWSLLDPWNDWLVVEALAADGKHLEQFVSARREWLEEKRITEGRKEWAEQSRKWLSDLELA